MGTIISQAGQHICCNHIFLFVSTQIRTEVWTRFLERGLNFKRLISFVHFTFLNEKSPCQKISVCPKWEKEVQCIPEALLDPHLVTDKIMTCLV